MYRDFDWRRRSSPVIAQPLSGIISMSQGNPIDLHNFNLAEASTHDPRALVNGPEDQVGALILALSTAYNDLKGIVWIKDYMRTQKPDDDTIIEHRGQWNGIGIQLNKYAAAIVFEVLKLIKTKQKLIHAEEFQEVISNLGRPTKALWTSIFNAATVKGGFQRDPFGRALQNLRNHFSSHYYNPTELVNGYLAHFSEDDDQEEHRWAYVSHGASMEQTRYYFADAAVEKGMEHMETYEGFLHDIGTMLSNMNQVLSAVIIRFVEIRTDSR